MLWRGRLGAVIATAGLAAAALVSAAGPANAGGSSGESGAHGAATAPLAGCRAPAPHAVVRAGSSAAAASGTRAGSPPAAVFRVDQIGYPSAAAKLAALMTRTRRAGTGWMLISRHPCRVVARGVTKTNLGSWSRRYPAVWAVRFSGVHGPGTYRLALTAHPATVSPWFTIGPASGL